MRNTFLSEVYSIFHVFLKLIKWYLVPIFKLSIILSVLLDCIIGEMNFLVVRVIFIHFIITSWRSNVTFPEKIAFSIVVNKHPHSNVKFPIVNEEWSFYIFLDYKAIKLKNWFVVFRCFLFDCFFFFFISLFILRFIWTFNNFFIFSISLTFFLWRSYLNFRTFTVFLNQLS